MNTKYSLLFSIHCLDRQRAGWKCISSSMSAHIRARLCMTLLQVCVADFEQRGGCDVTCYFCPSEMSDADLCIFFYWSIYLFIYVFIYLLFYLFICLLIVMMGQWQGTCLKWWEIQPTRNRLTNHKSSWIIRDNRTLLTIITHFFIHYLGPDIKTAAVMPSQFEYLVCLV